MSPYYQPPRYDLPGEPEKAPSPPPPVPERREPPHGWFYYLGGFLLLIAGVCLVWSNSTGWHPAPLPPRVPPAAASAAK